MFFEVGSQIVIPNQYTYITFKMAKKTNNLLNEFINGAVLQAKSSEEIIKENIVILPELQSHIPPLSADEFAQLEHNIVKDGCRDALITWDTNTEAGKKYVLIDGHNRYKICLHHKLNFRVEILTFENIAQVKNWMINNQLGKRNVTEEVKSYLRGQQYHQQKDSSNFKGNQFTETEAEKEAGKPKQKTHERLAEFHKVSPKTIQRDEKYSLGLDKLADNNQELKWKILQRDIVIPKGFVENLLDKTETEIIALRTHLIEKNEFPTEIIKNTELIDTELASPALNEDTPKNETTPKTTQIPKEVYVWDKWEMELIKAFKKLKKKRGTDELDHIKSIITQIENEMTQ